MAVKDEAPSGSVQFCTDSYNKPNGHPCGAASPTLNGKQPLWGQTMNADFVKPAALALGLVTKG